MVLLKYIRFVLLMNFVVECTIRPLDPELLKVYDKVCQIITKEPYFDSAVAIANKWTVYYSWNLNLTQTCPEVSFNYPNDEAINRIYSQMNGYLETQPPWSQAVLDMNMEGRGMLLFNHSSEVPGKFLGVPFMEDHEYKGVFMDIQMPLIEFSMKLLFGGKYLLSSSCHVSGGTVLAVRRRNRPKKEEIDSVASTLNFGTRYSTCIKPF